MKPFINLFIGAMFCFEIMSPFMLGYLNQESKNRTGQRSEQKKTATKNYVRSSSILNIKSFSASDFRNWKGIDHRGSEANYSDSKSLNVKEKVIAFDERVK